VTTSLEIELASIAAAFKAADEADAPTLLRAVQSIRAETVALDDVACDLEAMAKRMATRMRALQRLEARGVLDDTGLVGSIADLADDD
jgi:hypothetical protein